MLRNKEAVQLSPTSRHGGERKKYDMIQMKKLEDEGGGRGDPGDWPAGH